MVLWENLTIRKKLFGELAFFANAAGLQTGQWDNDMVGRAVEASPNADVDQKHVILVVEDEVLLRSMVAEFLRDAGFVVIEAANAIEAGAVIAARTKVHIVFSDIQMPGDFDGIKLADWISARCPDVHVLLTSGALSPHTESGIAGRQFVSKPYALHELERRLRGLLAGRR